MRRACFNAAPAFLADLTIRHPGNDNAVLLWHCGAPLSMCHAEDRVRLAQHWILPSTLSGMTHFRLKEGPITVARFDAAGGKYMLAVGEGRSVEGPATLNNYVWMEVDDWPQWERKLIEGPFIHHVGMVYGHYADALVEACKYIPGLKPLRLDSGGRL
jgi:L-fucose isomerase-like protein